jgi:hypothetical protein
MKVIVSMTRGRPNKPLEKVLQQRKEVQILYIDGQNDQDVLSKIREEVSSEKAFFFIRDRVRSSKVNWRRVFIQGLLGKTIVFIKEVKIPFSVVDVIHQSSMIRSIIDRPKIFLGADVYLLTPEIFSFLQPEKSLDWSIEQMIESKQEKRPGPRERSDVYFSTLKGRHHGKKRYVKDSRTRQASL